MALCHSRQGGNRTAATTWEAFCDSLNLDPTLADCPDPIPPLQLFAHRYRTGEIAPGGAKVRGKTVGDALRAVGQAFSVMGIQAKAHHLRYTRHPPIPTIISLHKTGQPTHTSKTHTHFRPSKRRFQSSTTAYPTQLRDSRHDHPGLLLPATPRGIRSNHKSRVISISPLRCSPISREHPSNLRPSY